MLTAEAPGGLKVWTTGPAGFTADLVGLPRHRRPAADRRAGRRVRHPADRLPIAAAADPGALTSVFALCVALLAVWWLAYADVVLNGQVQGILFILVIGAATDYALLYVARFREAIGDRSGAGRPPDGRAGGLRADHRLGRHRDRRAAVPAAHRSRHQQGARPDRLDRHRVLGARRADLPARAAAGSRRTAFWPLRPKLGSAHPAADRRRCPRASGRARALRRAARPAGVDHLDRSCCWSPASGCCSCEPTGSPRATSCSGQSGARRPGGARRALPRRLRQPGRHRPRGGPVTSWRIRRGRLDGIDGVVAAALKTRRPGTVPVGRTAQPFPFPTTARPRPPSSTASAAAGTLTMPPTPSPPRRRCANCASLDERR